MKPRTYRPRTKRLRHTVNWAQWSHHTDQRELRRAYLRRAFRRAAGYRA